MKVLISLHDVMPGSLNDARSVTELMESLGLPPAPLLVSCGLAWEERHIDVLREFAGKGHALVAHGWTHHARNIRGLRHRIHALLLSRDQAEHLALSPAEIVGTMRRCFEWFAERGLPEPAMYVPPAWGMGRVTRRQLQNSPFRWFETLTGVYDSRTDFFRRLPLAGFQADTALRKYSLGALNAANITFGRLTGLPVRLAIHPHDLELRLAGRLRQLLDSDLHCLEPWAVFRDD
jgi:hypothetical protein